jgi:1-acyl-sn-glycerol-3-phosphate acyltransferase
MIAILRSLWAWFAVGALIVLWLPLLTLIRLFDRDPVYYTTGRWFRRLGVAMTKANPAWQLRLTGQPVQDPRRPYVVVSNHQSMADIPLISHLPWEMKWVGKVELFRVPFTGWMMKLAGDIPVDRKDPRSGAKMLLRAHKVLQKKCSVMFFPEGTRSRDGKVGRFIDGAFHLAIKAQVPVLPLALEGSYDCLPKKSWIFGKPAQISLKVLPPVDTAGLTSEDIASLRDRVRGAIMAQVAEWRGTSVPEVDALA